MTQNSPNPTKTHKVLEVFETAKMGKLKDSKDSKGIKDIKDIKGLQEFNKNPKRFLLENPEIFELRGDTGGNIIHYLIKSGEISLLENCEDILTKEMFESKDFEGNNNFTLAAVYDKFEYIPKKLVTKELLLSKDMHGQSILDHVVTWRKLGDVPKELLDEELLFTRNSDGDLNLIERSALNGALSEIPKKFLTKEILTKENGEDGEIGSIIDLCACGGCLGDIPEGILSIELLAKRSKGELSNLKEGLKTPPIHLAGERGMLYKVPEKFLCQELITLKNEKGDTPLHLAAMSFFRNPIPKSLFKEEYLTMTNNANISVLDNIFLYFEKRLDDKTIEKVLKAMSTKGLKTYLEKYIKRELEGKGILVACNDNRKNSVQKVILKELDKRTLQTNLKKDELERQWDI
jgi:hypothetical protein